MVFISIGFAYNLRHCLRGTNRPGYLASAFVIPSSQQFYSELPIAKNQNTFAKRQREQEKKQRANDKQKKREQKKDGTFTPAPPRSYAFPAEENDD